jgi:type IV pilus assembly protein PilP
MRKSFLLMIFVFLSHFNYCSSSEIKEYHFIHGKTEIKNPYDVRDPFKRRSPEKKGLSRTKERSKGIFNNSSESIENNYAGNIQIIGVMIGKERRAMAKSINGKETFVIKEGMKIGTNGAEVKAILPGGVVLAEKIMNVYDQEEYLETVLPIAGN